VLGEKLECLEWSGVLGEKLENVLTKQRGCKLIN